VTAREQILALQWAQLKHDESYHKDIVILPPAQRMKHMTLHYTKYTAHILDAVERDDDTRLAKTVTDAFIIALASANTLNQDLGLELGEITEASPSLTMLGNRFATDLNRSSADPLWLVRAFARHTGRLAKACESWDHLEAVPFLETMKNGNAELFKALLAEASARGLHLADTYKARICEIENRSIFARYSHEDAGSKA